MLSATPMKNSLPLLVAISAAGLSACGGQQSIDSVDASAGPDAAAIESGSDAPEGGGDARPLDCTYDDGGAVLDASSRFQGSCDGGCPTGTFCAVEIGGVAGGGGEYCAPIMDRCKNDVSCACLASCVCGSSFGRAERCTDGQPAGTVLDCDNGIR